MNKPRRESVKGFIFCPRCVSSQQRQKIATKQERGKTQDMANRKTQRMNLKLFRVEKGLTQSEMATAIGCARPTYSLIEEGARGGRFEFWNAIQETFDVPSEKMFELMKCGKE